MWTEYTRSGRNLIRLAAMSTQDPEITKKRLAELESEHRDLDEVIQRISADTTVDQLRLQRFKKRKLALKDQIIKLQSDLLPDIIA